MLIQRKSFLKMILLLLLVPAFLFLSHSGFGEEKLSEEELKTEISELKKLLKVNQFLVQYARNLDKQEKKKHFVRNNRILAGMQVKLFYSMGKIHGYVVFLNTDDDYAIIDNASLKLTLDSRHFSSGTKTVFVRVKKNGFKKLTLSRGDTVIGFPVDAVKYGKKIDTGSTIQVRAECFQFKAETAIQIY
ncbi:MAG: hypothetical protein GY754_31330 [bacterium]|nr:hypothetical protein [bacterium]